MRSTAPTFLVFFNRKCTSQESCRIPWVHFPCVFSSKINLGFTSDCEFTCDAASRSRILYLFSRKRASRKPFQIPGVFSMKMRLGFNVIVNYAVDRSHIPCHFPRKCASQESCRIAWAHFPCVFSNNPRLAFRSDCEFTCDAANCSLTPNIFPRKTRLAGGIPRGSHCHCKFSFVPKPGQLLTKEHCTGDVGLFDSQFLKNRGSLL